MIEFRTVKVKEIGKVVTGHTPPTQSREYYGEEFVFIKPTDINIGERYVIQTEEKLSKLAFEKFKKSLIPPFSTCVVTIGSLGKKMCFTKTHCFTNQAINSIIPFEDFDNLFVYYLFKYVNPAVESLSNGTASGRDNVSKRSFENLNIIVPKCKKYQQITGSILSLYDDLSEANHQRMKLLENTATELYKEWFVRMRFPGYIDSKFKKGVPEGWVIKELSFFGKIFTGKTPPTRQTEYYGVDIPFIKTPDLHKGIFVVNTEEGLTEKGSHLQKRSALPKGAICVSCIGTGGIVGITTAKISQTNQQINSLIPDNKETMEFLFMRLVDLKETIELFGGTGATMTNLSKGKFEQLKILYPQKEMVRRYHDIVRPMFEQIENLQKQNIELRQIRDRLLPRLISGKLKVKTAMEEVTCP